MCFELDSVPPIAVIRGAAVSHDPRCGVLGRVGASAIDAPCILASERASHPGDERRSAKPS